jgi:hypothetical protein
VYPYTPSVALRLQAARLFVGKPAKIGAIFVTRGSAPVAKPVDGGKSAGWRQDP